MAGVVSALLRAGLAVKLGQLRQATSSYMQDRVDQGRTTAAGYVVGGAFYAAAGVFLIAALLVGSAALFRWVEINYGLFQAFGATAAVLIALMVLCAIVAATAMRPPRKNFPSLGSRLKTALYAGASKPKPQTVAATATPARVATDKRPAANSDPVASARNTASSVLRASPQPQRVTAASDTGAIVKKAGAAAAVGLLGWALSRRYSRPDTPIQVKRRS